MIRLALILCHLIAACSGPRPCCCAAPPPAKPVPAAKADAPPKTCPLCVAAEEQAKPEKPKPAKKHDCPCPNTPPVFDSHPLAAVTAGEDHRQAPSDGWLWDHLHSVAPLLGSDAVLLPPVGPPPGPSYHLLSLCHRLRC